MRSCGRFPVSKASGMLIDAGKRIRTLEIWIPETWNLRSLARRCHRGFADSTGRFQIDYDGQILYAVSQYLTIDLNYKLPE